DQCNDVLLIADLFLIPSGAETFGLAALEAMSCSVPVISSDIGGLIEVNILGETGYLCNLDDTECMADYAVKILQDEGLHQQMARNARSRAKKFEMNKVIEVYENYYRSEERRVGEVCI